MCLLVHLYHHNLIKLIDQNHKQFEQRWVIHNKTNKNVISTFFQFFYHFSNKKEDATKIISKDQFLAQNE